MLVAPGFNPGFRDSHVNQPPAQSHLLESNVHAGGWKRVLFCFHRLSHESYDCRNYKFLRYGFGIANPEQHAGWKRVLFSFSSFFCLNAKEPKSQVVAKLQPHLPGAGPLPRQPTSPSIRAIVVNDFKF
ncbi:hypothetical protein AAGF08_20250 [Algoriphagus sp. SE2]|uniref:hypothetical protein n=1 Tax=Algoriphagus sp. SE2 TaxID=3141536 RepID=UPI0031CCFB92